MFKLQNTFQSLLKDGFKTYSGVEEAIIRNIEAVKEISNMTRTSLGPNGMNKFIINHLDKVFLTKDTGVMCKELEVNHPAANLIVKSSNIQETECGDNTNYCITYAGELLNSAEELIKSGVHITDIISGYEKGLIKATQLLESSKQYEVSNIRSVEEVSKIIRPVIMTKVVRGQEDFLSSIIADACILTCPKNAIHFNEENVRVAKMLGGSIYDSQVIKGMVVVRHIEGAITHVENCKVAVFNCPFENIGAETKDTVLFKSAEELLGYSKSEEDTIEKIVKGIVDAGIKAVIVGGSVSNMAIHYLDRYKVLVLRTLSKFELRRIAKAVGAIPLVRLGTPSAEEMGYADKIAVDEVGSQKCVVIERDSDENKMATILVRGSTNNLLDNIERIIEDGVNAYKNLCRSNKYVSGAGAIEAYLSNALKEYAKTNTTLEQYSITKFGESFEIIPRTIMENAGLKVNEGVAQILSKNLTEAAFGVNFINGEVQNSFLELKIFDHMETKKWAIKFALDAVLTILRVDQIVLSKPAGGPKAAQGGQKPGWDNEEDPIN
jgi:T-complex protein 1 subunit theta